jgi:hypothetical protein
VKAASDAWLSAPAAEQASRLATLEGIRWLELGVRNYQRSMQGLTLTLLAAQIVLIVRIPRPIGYAMPSRARRTSSSKWRGVKYH